MAGFIERFASAWSNPQALDYFGMVLLVFALLAGAAIVLGRMFPVVQESKGASKHG